MFLHKWLIVDNEADPGATEADPGVMEVTLELWRPTLEPRG
jgi:hypothetical protein